MTATITEAQNILGELLEEIALWDVPQYDDCGAFCNKTTLGRAFDIAKKHGLLYGTPYIELYGGECGDENE